MDNRIARVRLIRATHCPLRKKILRHSPKSFTIQLYQRAFPPELLQLPNSWNS